MSRPLMGPRFPFRILGGAVERATGFDKVDDDVRHLLLTRLGERVMLRGFGGGVHHRFQEPNDSTLHALVRREIEDALAAFLPQVRLVGPVRVGGSEGELTITLEYLAAPMAEVRRLVLPVG